MAPQNIYDNPIFFELYSEYPRAKEGEKGASEWPELLQMLPHDLNGKRVLDLACGEGWFARWCVSRGAKTVDACDISVNMLRKAEGLTKGPKTTSATVSASGLGECGSVGGGVEGEENGVINFTRVDLETLQLPGETYDLVFCGLALHYVKNLGGLMRQVHSSLMPGGLFVYSIEHPFLTAPVCPKFIKTATAKAGATVGDSGEVDQWTVDSYFAEGVRSVDWIIDGVIKQHRTLTSYFESMREAGFEVEKMDEWGATNQSGRKHPDWVEGVIPRFLLVKARRKGRQARPWGGIAKVFGFSSQ
ncbi:methyltransferase domain-containing protein [Diaporthe amygdali]|uniref:methyltransferase domain-containing protein n=1 Tax=Phomopsis amygdali TaxID=1214568 RepID=UPI0022FF2C4A|nr:methyltransferase domain-containing protein [Diaporthe amygdali]KAJ0117089.1 methyltransferase domain-containing protein [Diaporthe amygdali]